jgi:GT2 family glycosyltransferase
VVAYGDHVALAERFLSSLYRYTEPELFHLRAGLNEVAAPTHALFRAYEKRFGNVSLYVEPKNRFKSPLMRRILREPWVSTEWTIWCDDDTHFGKPDWLQRLALRIEGAPHVTMWGMQHLLWQNDVEVLRWIQTARWYRGVPFLSGIDLSGNRSIEFRFACGGFWAARTAALRALDWPDPRLVHANEDFMLGEALRQNGMPLAEFHYGLNINDAPRRNDAALEVVSLLHSAPTT